MPDRSETTAVAFTLAVQDMQRRLRTREAMRNMASRRGCRTRITPELQAFLATRDSFFLGTATAEGRPYIQHRGGPPGFLMATGPQTLEFPDYAGNRQFLTLGNLAENNGVHLFLIDFETRQRINIWGRGRVLDPEGDRRIEILVEPSVANWRKHIQLLHSERSLPATTERLTARIAELEAEIARRDSLREQ